jgi:hypothetical protein
VRLTDHKTKGATPSPPRPKRRADLMAGPSHDRGAAPAASAEAGVGQVEILNAQGKVLHRGPTLVALNGGSMYRVYVITGTEHSAKYDPREFMVSDRTVRRVPGLVRSRIPPGLRTQASTCRLHLPRRRAPRRDRRAE